MLLALRHKLAYGDDNWQTKPHKPAEARAFKLWRIVVSNSLFYRLTLGALALLQRPFVSKNGIISKVIGPAGAWTKDRDLPPLAKQSFHKRWQKKKRNKASFESSGVENG